MGKTPYLLRRGNTYYFRCRIPKQHQELFNGREIVHSLRTSDRLEAIPQALALAGKFKSLIRDLKAGRVEKISKSDLLPNCAGRVSAESSEITPIEAPQGVVQAQAVQIPVTIQEAPQSPLLSVVVEDFLNRYDENNKAMYTKLVAFMPIFVELMGDKPSNQILQAHLNRFFDEVQKLPARRDGAKFKGLSLREMIEQNDGPCISQKTFYGTYRCCIGIFIQWAFVNYADQGFPRLSVQGADYRGERGNGIRKQRAPTHEELETIFGSPKMKEYSSNPETQHYRWLPLIGVYTGCRINEATQLNPFTDIRQDESTGIWFFHFTDESETADGVDKSIKTKSSKRIVPIHSSLIDLGFLDYVEQIKAKNSKILFPQWRPRDGKASANASKWFARYLDSIGLRDESEGSRLSGFHCFRHNFVTFGINNRIPDTFALTGHEINDIEGFGKLSDVVKGYWSRGLTDNIESLKESIEKFDFKIPFFKGTSCKIIKLRPRQPSSSA